MRWLAQVGHVALKDVRMTRWLARAYLVLAVLAALQVGLVLGTLWSVALMLVAIVLVAQVVHADSPLRDNALWITRPLPAGAVFSAKLLSVLLLLLLSAVATAVWELRYGFAGLDLALRLLGATGTFVWILAGTALAAALTRSVGGFALALVGGVITWSLAANIAAFALWRLHLPLPADAAGPLLALGSLAIVWDLYASGRRRRAIRLVLPLLAAVSLLTGAGRTRARAERELNLPVALRPDSLVARAAPAGGDADAVLPNVRVVGGRPEYLYVLELAWADLRMPDGRSHLESLARASVSGVALPRLPGATWAPGAARDSAPPWTSLSLLYSHAATLRGSTVLSVGGRLDAWQARVTDTLELRPGASHARNGRRVRLDGFIPGPGLRLIVSTEQVGTSELGALLVAPPNRVDFAVLDPDRRLLYPLVRQNSSPTAPATALPALFSRSTLELRLLPDYAGGPAAAPSGKRLRLLVLDWRRVGGYGVTVRVQPPADSQATSASPATRHPARPKTRTIPKTPRPAEATSPAES